MHNMFKNRKGFSLVELMIVVVIMGILVAVAIPLYGAITKNAEKRTCRNNQKAIRTAYARLVLNDQGQKANSIFKDGVSSYNGTTQNPEDVFRTEFLATFDGNELPECALDDEHFIISVDSEYDLHVACTNSEHNG